VKDFRKTEATPEARLWRPAAGVSVPAPQTHPLCEDGEGREAVSKGAAGPALGGGGLCGNLDCPSIRSQERSLTFAPS